MLWRACQCVAIQGVNACSRDEGRTGKLAEVDNVNDGDGRHKEDIEPHGRRIVRVLVV